MNALPSSLLPLASVVDLEYMTPLGAALLYLLLAGPVLWMGMRSMAGLGPVRKWVAIVVRLALILFLVLMVAGIRWKRHLRDLQVLVLRDVSQSTQQLYHGYPPGKTLNGTIDDYLRAASERKDKQARDQIGVISFADSASIEMASDYHLPIEAKPITDPGERTDIAQAIQYALATFRPDMRHRLLLVSDGNQNAGSDLRAAVDAAASLGIPIDVLPLSYNVTNEVVLERLEVSRSWLRENEQATLRAILKSTNLFPVTGTLKFMQEGQVINGEGKGQRIEIPAAELVQTPDGGTAVKPRQHPERMPLTERTTSGVHRFTAVFEPDVVLPQGTLEPRSGDTVLSNNSASTFVFVQGKRRILYVDNVEGDEGRLLQEKLAAEKIQVERIRIPQMPRDLVALQSYDAIILANVPYGNAPDTAGGAVNGLDDQQDKALAAAVHNTGIGLLMIGGPDSFGAGGWRGRKLEEVLPVDMDVPAERQIAKGALALIMHACEIPQGNTWGTECAIQAIKTLSARDDVGIISAQSGEWDYPLSERGDGSKAITAVRRMQLGDMGDFFPCLDSALKALVKSDAKQKHLIIVSDGDPQISTPGGRDILAEYVAAKVTISTVTAYPHQAGAAGVPDVMAEMAKKTGGRFYGPIEKNPNQLPQIFVKESRIVVRSLIQEPEAGKSFGLTWDRQFAQRLLPGITALPNIRGLVLTTKKKSANVEMPLVTGPKEDPVFARWQSGLGKAAVFTSDAHRKWTADWVADPSGVYGKFWAQVVEGILRQPGSADFSVRIEPRGDFAEVVVEANRKEEGFINFLNMSGAVIDAEMQPHDLTMAQVGPGLYSGRFDIPKSGSYVVSLNYSGPGGKGGVLLSGLAVSSSPEVRDLQSNDAWLAEVAQRTGGRVLAPFDVEAAGLFSRQNLPDTSAPVPVWDLLLPWAVGLLLVDVATRRIAWDWKATKGLAGAVAHRIRQFTLSRKVESAPALDALRRVREEAAETRHGAGDRPLAAPPPLPSASAKFQAKGVEGDVTQVVGGATAKPLPPPPKKIEPKGGTTGNLLEAKRRAREQIKEKEQGGG